MVTRDVQGGSLLSWMIFTIKDLQKISKTFSLKMLDGTIFIKT